MSETSESQDTTKNQDELDDISDLLGGSEGEEGFKAEIDKLKGQNKFLEGQQ